MDLRLGEGDRDAEHPAALVGADADRREHGGVADDPAVAHLLVARIEDQIPDLAERPVAPGLQLVIKKLRRAADLRRRQALDAELAHHRLDLAGRHALDVHLRHRQHHGAHRAAAALQRLRVERRAIMAGGLGNLDGDRAGRRVDTLGLVAVGIALALGGALVGAGAQEPLPLDLHGKLERTAKDRGDVAGAMLDQMFQESLDRRILPLVHSRFSMGGFATPWDIRMGRPRRGMPRRGRNPAQAEFPDVRLRYPRRAIVRRVGSACRVHSAPPQLYRPWIVRHPIAIMLPGALCPPGRVGTGLASDGHAARSASIRCRSA